LAYFFAIWLIVYFLVLFFICWFIFSYFSRCFTPGISCVVYPSNDISYVWFRRFKENLRKPLDCLFVFSNSLHQHVVVPTRVASLAFLMQICIFWLFFNSFGFFLFLKKDQMKFDFFWPFWPIRFFMSIWQIQR